jgi:DNA-binding MarR family transcriptional regulator
MNVKESLDAELTLERFLPYRLSVLSNRVSAGVAASYRDRFALSVTEWRIMAVLGEFPGLSGEEVSNKTQIEKSILSRAVQKLLKRNLIKRSVDKHDRRRHVLNLSALGQEIYNQIVPLSLDYQEKLLSCLNDAEQERFSRYIDRMIAHAKALT